MTTGLERRDEGWSAVQAADQAVNRGYGDYIRATFHGLHWCVQRPCTHRKDASS